jgi:hypothetical protein
MLREPEAPYVAITRFASKGLPFLPGANPVGNSGRLRVLFDCLS